MLSVPKGPTSRLYNLRLQMRNCPPPMSTLAPGSPTVRRHFNVQQRRAWMPLCTLQHAICSPTFQPRRTWRGRGGSLIIPSTYCRMMMVMMMLIIDTRKSSCGAGGFDEEFLHSIPEGQRLITA